jgi:uncharacterized membrane protein
MVHVPLAAWLLTPFADGAALVTGDAFFSRAALWLTGVALAAALAAAAAGTIDVGTEKIDRPSGFIAAAHAIIMMLATAVTAAALLGRLNPEAIPLDPRWTAAAGAATALLALIGGWLGGELVHGRGVGQRAG